MPYRGRIAIYMSIFKFVPKPIKTTEIEIIVRDYLKQRGDINLDLDEVSMDILAGTPQWTLVQSVDNYILSLFSTRLYKIFQQMDKQLGVGGLPEKSSPTFGYCLQFFEFTVAIRGISFEDQVKIMKNVKKELGKKHPDEYRNNCYVDTFVNILLPQLQVYEIENFNANFSKDYREIINYNINDNKNLLNYYLAHRPELAKLIK